MHMLSGLIGWIRRTTANPIFLYIVISAVFFLSLGHYLGAHPGGMSATESIARNDSQSLSQILKYPLDAPHSIIAYILHLAGISWRSSLRLSSALLWIAFSLCFYSLAKSLFGRAIGIMGTFIFAATPLFMIMGRDGSAAILLYSIVAILAIYAWAIKSDSNQAGLLTLLVCGTLLTYIPGLLVWLIAAVIICRKKISALFEGADPPLVGAAILLSILILVPLALAIFRDWTLVKQLVLLPSHIPSPARVFKNIAWMILALFIKTPHHSAFLIGRLPVLNIISDALLVFGVFALWTAARLKLLAYGATVAYAVILAALNDNVNILALAVPALLIIITAGLRYLYIEWRSIFPRNPLAKNLALSLMWLVVVIQLIFGFRYAVSAWPSTADTHNTYVLK